MKFSDRNVPKFLIIVDDDESVEDFLVYNDVWSVES
jgi:hypothetical protein